MRTLSIIKSEHRNLGAVLFTLEKLVDEVENGKTPEFKVFHGLLTYIDRFLDAYHHPKETQYLFPTLRKRCPEISAVLDECIQEHDDGEKMLAEVLKALSAYEFLGDSELENFSNTLRHYTSFEREHAIQEEKQILPLAWEKLEPGDWERIDAVFADHEDPLFGDAPRRGFEDLLTAITTTVSSPYALGPGWR